MYLSIQSLASCSPLTSSLSRSLALSLSLSLSLHRCSCISYSVCLVSGLCGVHGFPRAEKGQGWRVGIWGVHTAVVLPLGQGWWGGGVVGKFGAL